VDITPVEIKITGGIIIMKIDLQEIIGELQQLSIDCTSSNVVRIWQAFDEPLIRKIRKLDKPLCSLFHNGKTVIVMFWATDTPNDGYKIEIENCHISDDQLAYYHGGLALFLNEIKPDIVLFNNFHFGLVFDDETDNMIYDEERYFKELKGETVFNVVKFIRAEYN